MPPSQVNVPAGTKGWAKILLACALVVAALLGPMDAEVDAFVNIRGTVETAMAELFQGPVELGEVGLSGLNRIMIQDLVVKDPLDDSVILLSVDELILRYSLLELVMHLSNAQKAINEIVLRGPRLRVRVEESGQWNVRRLFRSQSNLDGDTVALTLKMEKGEVLLVDTNLGIGDIAIGLDGVLKVNGSKLILERASLKVFGSEFVASGALDAGAVDLVLKGAQLDLGRITACFPQTQDIVVRGQAEMEVRASGSFAAPVLNAMVAMEKGRLEFPAHDHVAYSVDKLEGFFRYEDQILEVTKLDIVQGEARFQARGIIDSQGYMNLNIIAQSFDLADNLRFLETYGISGKANVAGVLSGTILQPDFQGELYVTKGTFWNLAYDELRGQVSLDIDRLQLTGWNIRSDRSIYALGGNIGFGAVPEVDLTLQCSAGRAEHILAMFEVPGDLIGRVDGTLEFRGVGGAWTTRGKVYMSDARYQGPVFESGSIEFFIGPDNRLAIQRGSVTMGDGIIDFSGTTQSDGTLALDVRVQNILADRFLLLKDWADQLEGRINLSGTASVRGSLEKPWLRMQLSLDESTSQAADMEFDVLVQGSQIVVNGRNVQIPARIN
ncbi:MAG: hypothetical protein GX855_02370 [Firmicutes bacterium]|nr:hypothetical protein [Bacillota bacterium]